MCDCCLVVVAVGFALPHVAVALSRLAGGWAGAPANAATDRGGGGRWRGRGMVASLAAATEAATVGPQLCVVLSAAELPYRASLLSWRRPLHLAAAAVFAASLVAA